MAEPSNALLNIQALAGRGTWYFDTVFNDGVEVRRREMLPAQGLAGLNHIRGLMLANPKTQFQMDTVQEPDTTFERFVPVTVGDLDLIIAAYQVTYPGDTGLLP